VPGPQNGRYASEPIKGLTSLKGERAHDTNASISLALARGDTVARITGEAPAIKARPAAKPAEPELTAEAQDGAPDDLKRIKGVGPKLEATLNRHGIFHYHQIAGWTEADVASVDSRLGFKGRIVRDGWIEQAKALADKG
jgi:NADH-quinone oxidoreductase subunit E